MAHALQADSCIARFEFLRACAYNSIERPSDAVSAYRKALEIYEHLSIKNPSIYESAIACIQNNMANSLGSLEKFSEAESAFDLALKIYRKLSLTEPSIYQDKIAGVHNNLAILKRKLGRLKDSQNSYQKAIEIYKGLVMVNAETYEIILATVQSNAGEVFKELGLFSEAEKITQEALNILLKLTTSSPDSHQHELAAVQNNLGNILSHQRRFFEAESFYRKSLKIRLKMAEVNPKIYESDIAGIQSNLGNVLSDLRRLDEATIFYERALEIFRRLAKTGAVSYKHDIAMVEQNLGNNMKFLQRFAEAEKYCQAALESYEELAEVEEAVYVLNVANSYNVLGVVLYNMGRLEEAENAYQSALKIYNSLTEEDYLIHQSSIASLQMNLGATLVFMERFSDAESAFIASLNIYQCLAVDEPDAYEADVATIQNNIGNVKVITEDFAGAERCYIAAQEIYKRRDAPVEKARLLGSFGSLLTNQPTRRIEGIEVLREAMQIVEGLRAEVLSIERQQQIISESFDIYENLLIALIREQRFDEAFELAEKSRNRTLTDLMVSRDLEPRNAPPALLDEYRETLARARALNDRRPDERDVRGSNGAAPDGNSEGTRGETRGGFNRLEETYRQLDDLTGQLLEFDPEFLPRATSLKTDEIRQLARDCGQTLVSFRITNAGSFVFLVFPDGETDVVSIPDFSADDLQELMVNAPAAGQTESGGGWVTDYYNARQNIAATSKWETTLEQTLGELHARLMRPVQEKLRGFTDLVLVPNRALAILPLHACWWQGDDGQRHYWLDEYTIRYAPSLTIYRRCRKNEIGRGRQSLLGIANPTQDLDFAQWECREIEAIRGDANCLMLWNNAATRGGLEGALAGQHLLHFSCHGRYDLGAPLNSAIALAGPSELSLADIFQHIQLPQSWLVVLSACETGLSDFRQIADEQFGLSTGFLYAGAPTVYSSLWAVDDGSTALLMIMVYELLQSESNLDKATLLIRAQRQLRDSTTTEIEQLLAKRADSTEVKALKGSLNAFGPTERPYEHPVAWAAFQCVGV